MNLLKAFICLFLGHDIDPDESIVSGVMKDKRNWLCQCHRCGMYEMHDGAISGKSITLTKREAYKAKKDFEHQIAEIERIKNAGIYPCDPEKNAECKKRSCYINGGPCKKTTRKECRIEEYI